VTRFGVLSVQFMPRLSLSIRKELNEHEAEPILGGHGRWHYQTESTWAQKNHLRVLENGFNLTKPYRGDWWRGYGVSSGSAAATVLFS
jgi:hypothetical protein